MVGLFFWGAMYLARTIEYAVQTGRARDVSLKWLLPLTGLRAVESGVDRRVFGIIIVTSTLVFVASGPAAAVSGFRTTRVTGTIVATG